MTDKFSMDRLEKLHARLELDGQYVDSNIVYLAIKEITRLRNALRYIGNDYVELSYEKVHWQRDDHMKTARIALAESYKHEEEIVTKNTLDNNF